MAGAGLGRGMALIARWEHCARQQPREALGVARAIFGEEIGRELVDEITTTSLGARARGGRRSFPAQ